MSDARFAPSTFTVIVAGDAAVAVVEDAVAESQPEPFAVLTPIVRRFALHIGAFAAPSARNVHRAPVPRLGGVAIVVAFFSGVQLFFLGVMGEYVGRIYDETRRRPKYIVDESYGFDAEN